jgi:hypothetical protein
MRKLILLGNTGNIEAFTSLVKQEFNIPHAYLADNKSDALVLLGVSTREQFKFNATTATG